MIKFFITLIVFTSGICFAGNQQTSITQINQIIIQAKQKIELYKDNPSNNKREMGIKQLSAKRDKCFSVYCEKEYSELISNKQTKIIEQHELIETFIEDALTLMEK